MLLLLLLLKFYTYHVDTHAMIYSTPLQQCYSSEQCT